MDNTPRYAFEALRKDFNRLKELLCLTNSKSIGKIKDDGNLQQQIQTLTTNVESHFEKLGHVFIEGQKCTESRMEQMEQLIRQRSVDDYEEKIKELKLTLQDEKTSRLRSEDELRESQQKQKVQQALREEQTKLTKAREEDLKEARLKQYQLEQNLTELSNQLDYSRAKVKCLEEKCQSREAQRLQQPTTLNNKQSELKSERIRSFSCEDVRGAEGLRVSPSNSCISLSTCDFTDDETDVEYTQSRRKKSGNLSHASVDTYDSAFSESPCAEMLHELNQKIEKLIQHAEKTPKDERALLNLPTLLRGFCVNIQESVSSPDGIRLRQFSRSLGVDFQQIRDHGRDLGSTFWTVIHEWYSLCDTASSRATMLSKLIQACYNCGIPYPLEVKPMPTKDRLIIESNYSYLVDHLMVHPALIYLRDCKYLCSSIIRYVTEPQSDPEPERIMRFVDILPVCGQHALDHLIKALRKSEQSHIADRIVATDPERFAGFIVDHHDISKPVQNIDKKKKKRSYLKHMKGFFFKSKSYEVNNE